MVIERHGRVTLDAIAGFARLLHRLRLVFIVAGIAAAVWMLWAIFNPDVASSALLLAIAALLWVGLALGAGSLLPQTPRAIEPGDGWRLRLRKRLAVLAYGLALLSALVLTLLALNMTLRAIGMLDS